MGSPLSPVLAEVFMEDLEQKAFANIDSSLVPTFFKRSDKIKIPFDRRPGVIYEIKCCCNASYIGETGNNLLHRFREHLGCLTRYKNAERRLNRPQARHRGRPQSRDPQKIMDEALKASAVTEHAIHCSDDLRPQIICHESNVHLRRIKESLFIRNNCTINRDRGVEVSEHPSTVTMQGALYLEDGHVFRGFCFGACQSEVGELVFLTGMVGYVEALTDPSYYGQLLVFTYPLIGNYGAPLVKSNSEVFPSELESETIWARALIVSQLHDLEAPEYWKSRQTLRQWLEANGVTCLAGIDTRTLTKILRENGSMAGKIVVEFDDPTAYNFFDLNDQNLVKYVSRATSETYGCHDEESLHVVVVDCGMKQNQLRCLRRRVAAVTIVPWNHPFSTEECDGIFISNGPGDPMKCSSTVEQLGNCLHDGGVPIMAVCLGHQLLALAAGAKTYRMKFGHRSHNQPCKFSASNRCFITSQNHGYAVDGATLPKEWETIFSNANDGSNEGIAHVELPFFSVQFHPEHASGPDDTEFLFDIFIEMMRDRKLRSDRLSVKQRICKYIGASLMRARPPVRPKKVVVLGSGGLTIGQAGEFDYAGSQALKSLKEENVRTILINPNIATVQTMKGFADFTYFLPVTPAYVKQVLKADRPDGVLLSFGGQTALNCAVTLYNDGVFDEYEVAILGTPMKSIIWTEDRLLFSEKMAEIDEPVAQCRAVCTVSDAIAAAEELKYPVLVRAAYTLGGFGSGLAYNDKELEDIARLGLSVSQQLLVGVNLLGWKEIEYEVVRDAYDNCITVCNMENIDPVGIHTGESAVVAPSQTLSGQEYFKLRSSAIRIARHLEIVGECNVQFAVNPEQFEYRVIEVNARLSRSSALASKATGYPLAFMASKLALGLPMPELKNAVTGVTTACFEPAMDYCVVKIPRWDLTKFPGVSTKIGSSMKSIGESMGIGRSFEEAFQKALRMIDESIVGYDPFMVPFDINMTAMPTDKRLFYIASALGANQSVPNLSALTGIDQWFLSRMKNIVDFYLKIKKLTVTSLSKEDIMHAKQLGFSDRMLAACCGSTETAVRKIRQNMGVRPVLKHIDTVSAEWPAQTNYLYFTYNGDSSDVIPLEGSHMVLGSGVYRIGSSVEFDCCAVGCLQELKSAGCRTVMINCNPETVSTDYDLCDTLLFEEISFEVVMDAHEMFNPTGIILCMGGQLPNNIAMNLYRQKVCILGTEPNFIDQAENRYKFSRTLDELNARCIDERERILQPRWKELVSIESAIEFCHEVGYPCLVRPSYVLSGAAMNVAHSDDELKEYLTLALGVSNDKPVVISKFITEAKEIDVDAVASNGHVICWAISEHIENAGVHSGDATLVTPAQDINSRTMLDISRVVKTVAAALQIRGPFNMQLIAKDDKLQVIECNVRASRSFPFVSKALCYDFIATATRVVLGHAVEEVGLVGRHGVVCVKVPQFSFSRLAGAEVTLGVQMSSTGEVACFGKDRFDAYLKALNATGFEIPKRTIFLSIGSFKQKKEMFASVKDLSSMGYILFASMGTADFYGEHGIPVTPVEWPFEEGGGLSEEKTAHCCKSIADYLSKKQFELVINLPMHSSGFYRVSAFMTPGYRTRRQAIDYGIPLVTDVKCAKLLVQALKRAKGMSPTVNAEIDRVTSHFTVRLPGLIDVHVHMREPGASHKEDWTTGTSAALAGGITMVLAMPNTKPPLDSLEHFSLINSIASSKACCDFGLYLGATEDNHDKLSLCAPQSAGLKMYLNDTYTNFQLRNTMSISKHFSTWPAGKPIVVHAKGQTVASLMWLVSVYQRPVHVCHVSNREEITVIKMAKEQKLPVTCEVTPHHLFLNKDMVPASLRSVRPPLGTEDDRLALWEHLDVIDCFATDHAPHCVEEKLESASLPGFPGLELMLPLLINAVNDGELTLNDVITRLYHNPQRIFGLPEQPNTYVEVDMDESWIIPEQTRFCKSRWTPFAGRKIKGAVKRVVLRGAEAYIDGRVLVSPGTGKNVFPVSDFQLNGAAIANAPEKLFSKGADSTAKAAVSLPGAQAQVPAPVPKAKNSIAGQHVINAEMFDRQTLRELFSLAQSYIVSEKANRKSLLSILKGRLMTLLFYEASTRTQCSFAAAMQRLGGSVITVNSSSSSVQKGESLEDTVAVLSRYCDVLVLRHHEEGAAARAAVTSVVPIINAGDGPGDHPTQALLDIFTIREEIGTVNQLTIALVGDLKHSRTVHSLAKLLCQYQVTLLYVSPEELEMPVEVIDFVKEHGISQKKSSLLAAIPLCDVLYMTRLQTERINGGDVYRGLYVNFKITPECLSNAKEKMIVMHPLPRVDEIDTAFDSDPRASYFRQAEYGMYVRMALLSMIFDEY
uniref:Carbamoyl phosphate synthase arginine-specific large chain n=1 Tax=Trichuris muris TaxID=70415 RepID=A0A5S6QNK9_TRIMR